MNTIAETLFHDACHYVTKRDVETYSPNDPGYGDYVRLWSHMLVSKKIPESQFDLTEVISCANHTDDKEFLKNTRFRRYRVFTNSVAINILDDCYSRDWLVSNYVVCRLIQDLYYLKDPGFSGMCECFLKLYELLAQENIEFWYDDDSLFCLLGAFLVAVQNDKHSKANKIAKWLIAEEDRIKRKLESSGGYFLWDLTGYNTMHKDWLLLLKMLDVKSLENESRLVVETLLDDDCINYVSHIK